MLKMIWWLIKTIIFGCDVDSMFDLGFNFTFEEAYKYLKKGYFICEDIKPSTLYVMINGEIYVIETKHRKGYPIESFTTYAMNNTWKVIPLGEQINNKDE